MVIVGGCCCCCHCLFLLLVIMVNVGIDVVCLIMHAHGDVGFRLGSADYIRRCRIHIDANSITVVL